MPELRRRSVLATVGAAALGSLAGCGGVEDDRPPAGSLQFVNDHALPHSIGMRVADVGTAPGDDPGTVRGDPPIPPVHRDISSSTVLDPDETETYEGIFTADVWYAVRFTVDGEEPENDAGSVAFHPAPGDDERGTFLGGKIYASGEFSWVVSATDDPGPFGE